MTQRRVVILGSTGSIGVQALELVAGNPERFEVVGLAAAGDRVADLAAQVLAFRPEYVAVARAGTVQDLQLALYAEAVKHDYDRGEFALPRILAGPDAAEQLAGLDCDVVLNAMTGAVGLRPTLAALRAGRQVALANKESLVVGGPLVTELAARGQIVPVDSEHSAIAQCLRGEDLADVRRLVLTASGGPFRGYRRAELAEVSVQQALAHPNFAMGPVITINSATLVNKGLEVIEAHLLFGVAISDIEVVVHPEQLIHSMVEFTDGATIAQAAPPSMLQPIALGLGWPNRLPGAGPRIDWTAAQSWHFEPLDDEAFPAVAMAREAGGAGGCAPAIYNAANEVCVAAFRDGRLGFAGIVDVLAGVLEQGLTSHPVGSDEQLEIGDVLAADDWARRRATELVNVTGVGFRGG